jgi:hypothetical protein
MGKPGRVMGAVNKAELEEETRVMMSNAVKLRTVRLYYTALEKFREFLTLIGSTRAPTDAFAGPAKAGDVDEAEKKKRNDDDRRLLTEYLLHARKTFAHSTVCDVLFNSLSQYVSTS